MADPSNQVDDLKAKPTAELIRRRWEDGSDDLKEERREWWLNYSFLGGSQWVDWDRYRGNVVEMARDPKRVRVVVDRMGPNMESLMGRLTAKPLRFESKPTASDDATVAASKLSENVLNTAHDEQEWEEVRAAEILDAYQGATSLVYLEWDPSKGETLSYDEGSERVVGTGEIELCARAITEFCLQPGIRDPYKTAWWCTGVAMARAEAQRRYDLAELPPADAGTGKSALQARLWTEQGGTPYNDSCLVITCWQVPQEKSKGWVATAIGDKIVDGPHDWYFPFKEPNFALFTHTKTTNRWQGRTVLTKVRQPQIVYNAAWSGMGEHAKMASNNRIILDEFSAELSDQLTDEPGEILVVSSQAQHQPSWMVAPGAPRGLREIVEMADAAISDLMAVHDISRGDVNVNRTPSSTIAQLSEKDDTPLGRFAHNQATGWSRLGRLILETYEAKVEESRSVQIMAEGRGAVATRKWNGKMLRGQTSVSVPLDATKPFSRVAARQAGIELLQLLPPGTVPMEKLLQLWDIDPDDSLELLDPDAAKAKRENVDMAGGEVKMPAAFDDHAKHLAEHNAFRKAAAYEQLAPEYRMLVDLHVQAHATIVHEEAANQMGREMAIPGSASLPQANHPMGSVIPLPVGQRQGQQPQPGPSLPAMPAGG